jgi:hypothetical protein
MLSMNPEGNESNATQGLSMYSIQIQLGSKTLNREYRGDTKF